MKTMKDVVDAGLCTGCGLCFAPGKPGVPMVSFDFQGLCPGLGVTSSNQRNYDRRWGPIQQIHLGHSTHETTRYQGSSGGAVTALLIWLLEQKHVEFVVATRACLNDPTQTETIMLSDPSALTDTAGSRYCPSSPLADFSKFVAMGVPFAISCRPCDAAAARAYLRREEVNHRVVLLSFFCAGTPSMAGTHALFEALGTTASEVRAFRYRGMGWPGFATATTQSGEILKMTYDESWGNILNRHLLPRCKVCADGVGESADLVGADGWHLREDGEVSFDEAPGRSLIIARTALGSELLDGARYSNAVESTPSTIAYLNKIQVYQRRRKATAAARILALFILGRVTPKYRGVGIWKNFFLSNPFLALKQFAGMLVRTLAEDKRKGLGEREPNLSQERAGCNQGRWRGE